jgi:hypothetical protein
MMMMMKRTAGMVMTRRLVVVVGSQNGCASRSSFSPTMTNQSCAARSFSTSSSSDDDATTTTTTTTTDLSSYFHIEASNAARADATQLTVSGPDIDGMLASMTVALAVRGCSLMELHAGKMNFDGSMAHAHHHTQQNKESLDYSVKDVFCVTDRSTGKPFEDHELAALAGSLLESLKTPMNVLVSSDNNKGAMTELQNLTKQQDNHRSILSLEDQITIIPSTSSK